MLANSRLARYVRFNPIALLLDLKRRYGENHVFSIPERAGFEIRFPVVDGYAFALKQNVLCCDVQGMDKLILTPNREPVATFIAPTVGYQEGHPSQNSTFGFASQDRDRYYRETHLQTIKFHVAKVLATELAGQQTATNDVTRRVLGLQSRHQLFPQIFRFVDVYVRDRVDFHGCDPCELGLERYVRLMVERLRSAIRPDKSQGEPLLMPLLNRYKPIGTTSEVDFKTVRPSVVPRNTATLIRLCWIPRRGRRARHFV